MEKPPITLRVVIKYTLAICLTFGLIAYFLFQARLLLVGPVLEITNEHPAVSHERTVTIEGVAKNIVRITLNGRDIYTDKNGYFNEVIVLENGYTITTIEGTDRYGRTTSLTQSFVYTPE